MPNWSLSIRCGPTSRAPIWRWQLANFTGANDATEHPSGARKRTDLRARVVSSVVLGPLVLAAVFLGGHVFAGLIFLTALLSVREWVRLVTPGEQELAKELSYGSPIADPSVQILVVPLPHSPPLIPPS